MTEQERTRRGIGDRERESPDKDPMGEDDGVALEPLTMSSADAQPAPPPPGGAPAGAALDPDAGIDVSEEATWRREHPKVRRGRSKPPS